LYCEIADWENGDVKEVELDDAGEGAVYHIIVYDWRRNEKAIGYGEWW
jgi:hypothetical protein